MKTVKRIVKTKQIPHQMSKCFLEASNELRYAVINEAEAEGFIKHGYGMNIKTHSERNKDGFIVTCEAEIYKAEEEE